MKTRKARGRLGAFMMANKNDPSWKGGVRCAMCSHPKSDQINADVRAYFAHRSKGHEMPWSVFHREWLVPEYKVAVSEYSTSKHAAKCLKLKA